MVEHIFLLLLLLPCSLASTPTEFSKALEQPYAGYCAHPPLAQEAAISGPPLPEVLKEAGVRLVGVQVIFRHGARDLSSDKSCFRPMTTSFKNCSLKRLVAFSEAEGGAPMPLSQKILDAYPSMEENMPGSGYISQILGCGKGVLLDEAIPQTIALARSIKHRYFNSLPASPTPWTTRMYSTGKERTQATLFLLHKHLFGNGSAEASFFSRPTSSDPWDLNQHCPRVGNARHARHFKTDPKLIERRFPSFARRWREAAGTEFQASFKDCLLVAQCSGQEALRLPEALQPNSSLFKEALAISLALFQEHYSADLRDPESLENMQLLAAPALVEIDQFLQQQAAFESLAPLDAPNYMPLALWATHDTTILVLLVALGVWDGQWPPYTDTLLLEVYRSSDGQETFFRWLHRSVALKLPWCQQESGHILGLCSLRSFLPPAMRRFRDMKTYRRVCADVRTAAVQMPAPSVFMESLPLPVLPNVCVILGLGLSFVLGCKFQAWRSKTERSSRLQPWQTPAEYASWPLMSDSMTP